MKYEVLGSTLETGDGFRLLKGELSIDGKIYRYQWKKPELILRSDSSAHLYLIQEHGETYQVRRFFSSAPELSGTVIRELDKKLGESRKSGAKSQKVKSQMPGKILRIFVKVGQSVQKGDPLLVMEAMKMENEIRASVPGVVSKIAIQESQTVESGFVLLQIDEEKSGE